MALKTRETRCLTRAVGGDTEAFGDLYEMHLDAIYQYIYYRVSNRHDAEDLTEMVFLKAWQAIGAYTQSQIPFRAWLYRIAHNLVVDHYRTRPSLVSLDEYTHLENNSSTVEHQFHTRENSRRLAAAIRRLSAGHQHVLILRFLLGMSHAETAQILNRSEGAIRVLQHRGLKELQALMVVEEISDV